MAKQKGFIKLKGSLGGLTFYKSDGVDLVKTISGVSKERILKDPKFKRTRENMNEFGASAKIGKVLRMGFSSVSKFMKDSTLSGRLTGVMKRINSKGSGLRGKRAFEIVANKDYLTGFEFHKNTPFGSVFNAAFAQPTLDANRSVVTWVVPDFNTQNYINAPEGATHFKLVLNCSILSDYTYQIGSNSYEPINPNQNEMHVLDESAEIPLTGMVGSDTTLTTDFGLGAALPATAGVIVGIGILFYQEINGDFYVLVSDNTLRIELVG